MTAPLERPLAHTVGVNEQDHEGGLSPIVVTCKNCGSTRAHDEPLPGAEYGTESSRPQGGAGRYAVARRVCSDCGGTAFDASR